MILMSSHSVQCSNVVVIEPCSVGDRRIAPQAADLSQARQVLVGLACAQLAGEDFLVGLDRYRADVAGQVSPRCPVWPRRPRPGWPAGWVTGSGGRWRPVETGLGNIATAALDILTAVAPQRAALLSETAVKIVGKATGLVRDTACVLHLYDALGQLTLDSAAATLADEHQGAVEVAFRCTVLPVLRMPGSYRNDAALTGDGYDQDSVLAVTTFTVEQGVVGGRAAPGVLADVIMILHGRRVPHSRPTAGEPGAP